MWIDNSKFVSSTDHDTGRECLLQKLPPDRFHPIGEMALEPEDAEIVYFGDEVDGD